MKNNYSCFLAAFTGCLLSLFLISCKNVAAAPSRTTEHIKIDQFGYFPQSKKVAVIADPQAGLNANENFSPGTGANQYQVRQWSDDAVVYSGTIQVWNNGATHTQSGDRGWWFDFSAVSTPGTYYIFDVANNIGSFQFRIGNDVYNEVLKQAARTFFYQRINFAKQLPYAEANWTDGACFEGSVQDHFATSRFAKGDLATARDLSGGWMDAGDKNKYTTFALTPIVQLMEAYRMNPSVFKDNYGIPESGNGLPDILDEVKWELDFLKRMQDASGTNGFFLKVGVDNNNEVYPPSADKRARYYLPECTSSSLAGCAAFAVSGNVLRKVPALASYGEDLIGRAELAWERVKLTTGNFTVFQTDCDDQNIESGDADQTAERQLDNAVVAAVYLYEATGDEEYRLFAEANYANVHLYAIKWWGPYWVPQQLALLRFSQLPGVSATVAANIRTMKAGMDYQNSINAYNNASDLYRSQMDDASYVWGHNQTRSNAGNTNLDYITFAINPSRASLYREVAEQYLHWMHGVNPLSLVMLTNMYRFGASKSANEIFHTWFKNGTPWDNAQTSTYGPPPGYVPGGPNKKYSGPVTGITDQPHQKAYKDWNTDWPENSWEVTEPAIYYQASYIALLSKLMPDTGEEPGDTLVPSVPINLRAEFTSQDRIKLGWDAATDNIAVTGYDVYRDSTRIAANLASTSLEVTGLTCATGYTFTVHARDAAGNQSALSNPLQTQTTACSSIGSQIIYEDALQAGWENTTAACAVNLQATTFVKAGSFAVQGSFDGNGLASFYRGTALQTSAATQLRFWVYNPGKTGLKLYTTNPAGVKSTVVSLSPARGRWQEIVVNLAQLGNPANIAGIHMQSSSKFSATFYFDQVQLTNVSAMVEPVAAAGRYHNQEGSMLAWRVFPNPNKGSFALSFQSPARMETRIQLLDLTGRVVWQKKVLAAKGNNNLKLFAPEIARGQYLLILYNSAGQKAEKIIIAR